MTERIPIGAKVTLSQQGKKKWYDASNNPHNLHGVVTMNSADWQDMTDFPYRVLWGNSSRNNYQDGDLVPVIAADIKTEDFL